MDISLIIAILVAVSLIVFLIIYCGKKYSKPFSTTSFKVVCVLSCILLLTANGASFLNAIMLSLSIILYNWTPSLIDTNSMEMQYISIVAYILLAVMWGIMLYINIRKHGSGGIIVSLVQILLCILLSIAIYFTMAAIAPLVFLAIAVLAGCYLLISTVTGTIVDGFHGKKKPKTLTDNYGVTVEQVFDCYGNQYYVDGRKIRDSEGRYVELTKDQYGDYFVDEYGKIYR